MWKIATCCVVAFALGGRVNAEETKREALLWDLAALLAFQETCELTFSPDAIDAFIEQNVSADDLSFNVDLMKSKLTTSLYTKRMNASQKTVHCIQTKRVAKSLGGNIADEEDLDRLSFLLTIAEIITSQEFCDFTYDQDAIAAFIEENVPANDMRFNSDLMLAEVGRIYAHKSFNASQKTAHCMQMGQVSKSYGFIR